MATAAGRPVRCFLVAVALARLHSSFGVAAMTHSLPIPKELTALIDGGFWPRDHDQARAQNLHSLIPEASVRQFAPEEHKLFLLPPPFYMVSQLLKGPEEKFWADPRTALHEI